MTERISDERLRKLATLREAGHQEESSIARELLALREELSRPAEVVWGWAWRISLADIYPPYWGEWKISVGSRDPTTMIGHQSEALPLYSAPPRSYEDGVRDAVKVAREHAASWRRARDDRDGVGDHTSAGNYSAKGVGAATVATAIEALLPTKESPK